MKRFNKSQWRQERIRNGICPDCGKPLAPGLRRCRSCNDKMTIKNSARVAEHRRAGLCRCGRTRALGKRHCIECLDMGTARRYGVTVAEIRRLKQLPCEGCGTRSNTIIEHDHETMLVRGVLCGHCNSALGFAKEDPSILRRLARYAQRNAMVPVEIVVDERLVA